MSAAAKVKAVTTELREQWIWAPPLVEFLGDEEPSDDDAEDWIMRDLIPRGEGFLFGAPWKAGKTWLAIWLACCIANGCPFLNFENTLGRPGRVLLILLEDGRRRARKRLWQALRGMGLTPNDPTIREHLRIWDHPVRIPGDPKKLAEFVEEMKRWKPDVILIDSLTRAMTGSQNDIRDATAFTTAWRDIIVGTGASVGFLHHTNKGNNDERNATRDPFDKMRGSGELLAAPRNLIVMERLGSDDSKMSAVSMRGNLDLRRTSFVLEWTQETDDEGRVSVTLHDRGEVEDVRRELADKAKAARQEEKGRKSDRIAQTALRIASDRGTCSASTLAVVLGVVERTAARYLDDLRKRGLLGPTGEAGSPLTEAGRLFLESTP